jgi:hypothetical protein
MILEVSVVRAGDAEWCSYLMTISLLILSGVLSSTFSIFIQFLLEDHPIGRWYVGMLNQLPTYIAKPLGECLFCSGSWQYLCISYFIFNISIVLCLIGLGVNYIVTLYLVQKTNQWLSRLGK